MLRLSLGVDNLFCAWSVLPTKYLLIPLFWAGCASQLVSALPLHHRPHGVTVLACLFAFGTLASGLAFVSLLNSGSPLDGVWRLNPRAKEVFSSMGMWAPLLLGTVCLACAASAYGLFKGKRWGFRLGVTLLLLNLAGDVTNVALSIEPRAAVGVPVVAYVLWYLSSRNVRTFFSHAERGAA